MSFVPWAYHINTLDTKIICHKTKHILLMFILPQWSDSDKKQYCQDQTSQIIFSTDQTITECALCFYHSNTITAKRRSKGDNNIQALIVWNQVKTSDHQGVTTHSIIVRGNWSGGMFCFVYIIFSQLMWGRNIRPLMNYYYPTMFIQCWNKDILHHQLCEEYVKIKMSMFQKKYNERTMEKY